MKMFKIATPAILTLLLISTHLLHISCDGNEGFNEPSILAIYSGNDQTERVNATLPEPLVARVTYISGKPRPEIEVSFTSDDPGVIIFYPTATSDSDGFVSCIVTLGPDAGQYQIAASIEEDTDIFTATAAENECPEENPVLEPVWTQGNVFITTTSSSYIEGSGSVLIEFHPGTEETTKILETTHTIIDLAFSPHGELFLTSTEAIFKVTPVTYELETFYTFSSSAVREIEPNFGSVLACASSTELRGIFCPESELSAELSYSNISPECLVADPDRRDLLFITGVPPTFALRSVSWDGRSDFGELNDPIILDTGPWIPKGICSGGQGIFYITIDDDDDQRGIARVDTKTGTVDTDFFDFYAYFGGNSADAGRWGDIARSDNKLYLIDKFNDRLVVIGTDGQWLDETESDVFSMPYSYSERYGIAVAPRPLLLLRN
ncbi:MAG: Ig-like domain-containing protein [Candidatus Krumholzibacteriota bacterium]|nr:Ig-like domain-containing protein [Candidatus Krumholzibacteriota bacterium]